MQRKIWQLITAVVVLSSPAFAQQASFAKYFKTNVDGSQTLLNHVPRSVAMNLARKLSPAESSEALSLRVLLPSKNQAGLDNFVQQLYDPRSPNYHKFLTPQQFALLYGPSSADAQAVSQYLQSRGLTVTGQSKNGFFLQVAGQVSKIEPLFRVNINNYRKADGTNFFAPDANPTVPLQIAGKIQAIVGLDNAPRFKPHYHLGKQLQPKSLTPVPPPITTTFVVKGGHLIETNAIARKALSPAFVGFGGSIGPVDIDAAYNLNSVTSTGVGQTLAVFELDGYTATDITDFETYYSLPNVTLTNICTSDSPRSETNPCTGFAAGSNTSEVVLDIDLALAVAPGLTKILVYEAANTSAGWIDQWNNIASDDLAKVISCSWGEDEQDTPVYDHTVFSQLAAQGQTVIASTGDAGAYDNCDGGTLPPSCTVGGSPATGVLSVDDPASDVYVTGAGISALVINGDGSYNSESASSYGGGGISSSVSIPSFQTTMASGAASGSLVSTTMRNVPDVVFNADPTTVYGISLSGSWFGFWGSSASAPIWAGFIARVNQGRLAAGQTVVGYLNPALYGVAQTSRYSSDFHDITSGNNSFYPAKAGFDDATGLGSFNGANLYNDLIGPAAPTGLTPTAGDGQVGLSWTASSGAASYNVKRATVSGGPYTTISSSGAVVGTSYTSTGLTNGTTYYYVVSAVNSAGIEGLNSAQTSAVPAGVPLAPTTVSAAAGSSQATVTFSGATANGSTITSYTVTSSPGNKTGTGAASPITVTGLTPGTSYTFTVTATNGVGTSVSSVASNSVVPFGIPSAPTTVSAVAGNTQATVTFSGASDNGSAITSYTVTSSPGSFSASGSASPITVTGLTDGTPYTFTVTATNGVGTSSASVASNSVTPNIVPGPPTAVSAAGGDTQATVSFTAPAPNGGTAVLSYTVTSSPGSITASGAASPITVTGLTNGTAYTFTVVAVNATGPGTASAASNSVTPAGVPTAPTTVTAARGDTQAAVTFSGATSNGSAITGYTVTSNPGGITGTGPSSPITVTGLTNGTAYTFTVTAANAKGTSASSVASNSVTPAGLPTAPTTVSAAAGDTQATVTFSGAAANGSAITSYTVTSSPGGKTGTGAASPITVTGLTDGTAYTFTVTATNGVGTSAASAASNSVTPIGVPTAPATVSAAAGDTQATVTFSGAAANGSAITSYTVTSSPGNFTASGAASPLTVTGLTNGTAYTFTVTATNGVGTSAASTASNSVTPAGLPVAPTTVSAVGGNAQAVITFSGASANGAAITSYTVTSSPGSITASGTASPITVSGLTNGTPYTFTVTATNAVGTSSASAASNSVTPNIVPAAPTGVSAVRGDTQATVSFTAPAPNGGTAVLSYTVTSSPGGITASGAASPITVTGLTNGTAYTFTVVAVNATGPGAASAASNSVTPAGVPVAPTTVSAAAGDTQATVSFSGASANGSAITGYTATSNPGGLTASGTTSPITVTGLTNGTAYTFTVTATNAVGTSAASSASNSVTPAGLPAAPTTVSAVGGDTQATITFSGAAANGSAITGYTVTSSPGGKTGTGASSPITVTGLTNGTSYTFTVKATNSIGNSAASAATNSVTPAGVPVAPTTVSAVGGNAQAVVSFSGATSNGSAITGYTVTSNPGGITGAGASSPVTVSGLTNGTTYTFTVTATNVVGTSAPSAASNSVLPGLPSAPTTVSAVRGDTQAVVTFSGAQANGNAITNYTVTSSPGGFTGTGAASPITVAGLSNGTAYTFTVKSTNIIGNSPDSTPSNSVTPAGLPTTPTTVIAAAGDTRATVSFTASSANGSAITNYTVTSSPGGLTANGTISPITITGLTNGTSYTFTVTATNGVGTGAASTASNSIVPAGFPIPPTTVSAVGGDTNAAVSFSGAVANGSSITDYIVTSSPGGVTATGAASPITVNGLTNGVSYTFTVKPINGIGLGAASAATNAVVPAGLPMAPTTVSAVSGNTQATVSFSGQNNNGSPISGYVVTANPGGITATGTSSPIVVPGLTNFQAYTFTVTVINGLGSSPASVSSNIVVPSPVAPPTSLSSTILGIKMGGQILEAGISLTWVQSTSPNIVQNKIYRSANGGPYVLVDTIGPSVKYTDTTAPKGAAYTYQVTAIDQNASESAPSSPVAVNY